MILFLFTLYVKHVNDYYNIISELSFGKKLSGISVYLSFK